MACSAVVPVFAMTIPPSVEAVINLFERMRVFL